MQIPEYTERLVPHAKNSPMLNINEPNIMSDVSYMRENNRKITNLAEDAVTIYEKMKETRDETIALEFLNEYHAQAALKYEELKSQNTGVKSDRILDEFIKWRDNYYDERATERDDDILFLENDEQRNMVKNAFAKDMPGLISKTSTYMATQLRDANTNAKTNASFDYANMIRKSRSLNEVRYAIDLIDKSEIENKNKLTSAGLVSFINEQEVDPYTTMAVYNDYADRIEANKHENIKTEIEKKWKAHAARELAEIMKVSNYPSNITYKDTKSYKENKDMLENLMLYKEEDFKEITEKARTLYRNEAVKEVNEESERLKQDMYNGYVANKNGKLDAKNPVDRIYLNYENIQNYDRYLGWYVGEAMNHQQLTPEQAEKAETAAKELNNFRKKAMQNSQITSSMIENIISGGIVNVETFNKLDPISQYSIMEANAKHQNINRIKSNISAKGLNVEEAIKTSANNKSIKVNSYSYKMFSEAVYNNISRQDEKTLNQELINNIALNTYIPEVDKSREILIELDNIRANKKQNDKTEDIKNKIKEAIDDSNLSNLTKEEKKLLLDRIISQRYTEALLVIQRNLLND